MPGMSRDHRYFRSKRAVALWFDDEPRGEGQRGLEGRPGGGEASRGSTLHGHAISPTFHTPCGRRVVYVNAQKWRRVALLCGLLLAGIGFELLNPQIVRYFVDTARASGPVEVLTGAALLFLAVALLSQVVTVAETYVAENLGWTATNALRADLAQHCLDLDTAFRGESVSPAARSNVPPWRGRSSANPNCSSSTTFPARSTSTPSGSSGIGSSLAAIGPIWSSHIGRRCFGAPIGSSC